jgi:hypothetical protein
VGGWGGVSGRAVGGEGGRRGAFIIYDPRRAGSSRNPRAREIMLNRVLLLWMIKQLHSSQPRLASQPHLGTVYLGAERAHARRTVAKSFARAIISAIVSSRGFGGSRELKARIFKPSRARCHPCCEGKFEADDE